MDAVFQEEKKALAKIEQKIEDAASVLEQDVDKQNRKIESFICVDYADRQELSVLKAETRKSQERIDELRGYLDSPYFGRMDLDVEDDETTEVIYVGKTGISVEHDSLVSDWRSPVGQYFYMKSERMFRAGRVNYILQLRRSLDVKNGELISYHTEFDGQTVSLEGDVIDPFLLTVLKDKRRQNRLTDIIKTIQSNQNNIIRRPRNESFIVQGCAGSGKTMILLHRLSYLIFNHRDISIENIKIITPNSFFDAHINELSNELGLNRIERKSVEEFYVSLIKSFSRKMDVTANVSSEKDLNNDLLKMLYSEKYFNDTYLHYDEYWNDILSKIDDLNISEIANRMSVEYNSLIEHDYASYRKLDSTVRQLGQRITDEIARKDDLIKRIDCLKKEVMTAEGEEKKSSESLFEYARSARVFLQEALEYKKGMKDQLSTAASEQEMKISFLQKEQKEFNEESKKKHDILTSIQKEMVYLADYNFVSKRTDDIAVEILNELSNQSEKIQQIKQDIQNTPIYNFGKKNKLKSQLASAIEDFNEQSMTYITEYLNTEFEEVKTIDEKISEFQKIISNELQKFEKGKQVIDNLKNEIRVFSFCFELFAESTYPDISKMDKSTYGNLPAEVKKYEEAYRKSMAAKRRLENMKMSLKECELQHESVTRLNLGEADIVAVNNAIELVGKLKLSEISRNIMMKDMLAAYRIHGAKYRRTNYRHKLYIKLLFCYLYYRRTDGNNGTFINIDEAQDISKAEYQLMRLVLGTRCIFNLYGDVNQLVYEYKGINDWEEISEDIATTIFSLNENYRNTLQITNFCNKEFGAEVYPIGISGEEVLELNISDAIDWIYNIKKKNPGFRAAVIFRHGHSGISMALQKTIGDRSVSWFEIDDDKVSVLSVEKAKGLEFDVVVSVVDNMTVNEKYISYTRALDTLAVVRDHFEYLDTTEDTLEEETYEDEILPDESGEIDIKFPILRAEEDTEQNKSNEESKKTVIPQLDSHEQNNESLNAVTMIIKEAFGDDQLLSKEQEQVIQLLENKTKLACVAPSGWKKSIILFTLAKYSHDRYGMQSILTAEGHLQENELVLAEKLGLKTGVITDSMENFRIDFKKEKYDIIFVPYDFFAYDKNIDEFVEYFAGKVSYWGIDHPSEEKILWDKIKKTIDELQITAFLMSKTGFEGLNIEGFQVANIIEESPLTANRIREISFSDYADKKVWLSEHAATEFWGQGLVYCETENECQEISKILRKKKVKAEAYIRVSDSNNMERINYLANTFSKGGLPVLVTTHDAGKNLSNPHIRFIVHYSVPENVEYYTLHVSQIGKLAEEPIVFDLKS